MKDLMRVDIKDIPKNLGIYSQKLTIPSYATVHLYMYYHFIQDPKPYLTIPKMVAELNLSQQLLNQIFNFLATFGYIKKYRKQGEHFIRLMLMDEGRQNLLDPDNMRIAKKTLGLGVKENVAD